MNKKKNKLIEVILYKITLHMILNTYEILKNYSIFYKLLT